MFNSVMSQYFITVGAFSCFFALFLIFDALYLHTFYYSRQIILYIKQPYIYYNYKSGCSEVHRKQSAVLLKQYISTQNHTLPPAKHGRDLSEILIRYTSFDLDYTFQQLYFKLNFNSSRLNCNFRMHGASQVLRPRNAF